MVDIKKINGHGIEDTVARNRLDNIADYIVETGTDGIWTYEKWNSGKAVAWGITPNTSYSMTSSYTNGYYTNGANDLPSNLFITPPIGVASRWNQVGSDGLVSVSINSCSASEVHFYVYCSHSGAHNVQISYIIIGRWK